MQVSGRFEDQTNLTVDLVVAAAIWIGSQERLELESPSQDEVQDAIEIARWPVASTDR
jgi:hypothetical protein